MGIHLTTTSRKNKKRGVVGVVSEIDEVLHGYDKFVESLGIAQSSKNTYKSWAKNYVKNNQITSRAQLVKILEDERDSKYNNLKKFLNAPVHSYREKSSLSTQPSVETNTKKDAVFRFVPNKRKTIPQRVIYADEMLNQFFEERNLQQSTQKGYVSTIKAK